MSAWQELCEPAQAEQLAEVARRRRWGRSLALVGWLHLAAFSLSWWMAVGLHYYEATGYLAVWLGELASIGVIFRLSGGLRSLRDEPMSPLEKFVWRVWGSYFLLAFNLCSLNTLRGHQMFEFFPAMASLASFGFLVMTYTVHRRFFIAVLVMFAAGLLEAAFFLHEFLIFAIAWCIVLNGIAWHLRQGQTVPIAEPVEEMERRERAHPPALSLEASSAR
jgi:hypothetical protein